MLVRFGGHHAAAGVEVASDRLDALRDRFAEACAEAGVPEPAAGLDADAVLHDGEAASRIVGDLERFEPCGQGNPAPRVAAPRARLLGKKELRGGHLRLWIDVAGAPVSCFGAEMAALASQLGSHVRVVGALRRDTWQGGGAAEMRLLAAEPA
jgi:single-stranded-DNA-specific exonuclease